MPCIRLYCMLDYFLLSGGEKGNYDNHLGTPQDNLGTSIGVPTSSLGTTGTDNGPSFIHMKMVLNNK